MTCRMETIRTTKISINYKAISVESSQLVQLLKAVKVMLESTTYTCKRN